MFYAKLVYYEYYYYTSNFYSPYNANKKELNATTTPSILQTTTTISKHITIIGPALQPIRFDGQNNHHCYKCHHRPIVQVVA